MTIPAAWLCALLLLAPAASTSYLPGDGRFDVGPGPWVVAWSPERPAIQPALWRDAALHVPSGARLGLDAPVRLKPAAVYTLACLARGQQGPERLRLSCAGQSAEFVLSSTPTTYQLTFKTPGDEHDEPLEVWPEFAVATPRGAPGLAVLDDVRLVDGPRALAARTVDAADVTWTERIGEPMWLAADSALTVRLTASTPATGGTLSLLDLGAERAGEQAPRRTWPLDAPATEFRLPLTDLAPGMYLAEARFASPRGPIVARRHIAALRNLTGQQPRESWSFDSAALSAESAAVGLRAVRRVASWASLVDAQGTYRWRELDADMEAAFAAGIAATLVLDVSPASTLPRDVVTRRDGQPDLDRFLAFATTVAKRYAGHGVTYELDHEPWRTWGVGDYVEYLARFATTIRATDAGAKVAGLGCGFEAKGGGRLAPFLLDGLRKQGQASLDRVTLHLPSDLGARPERLWSTALDQLAAMASSALGTVEGGGPAVDLVAAPSATGALEPRLGETALSPWQLAARTIRARLLSLRAGGQVGFSSGWRGQADPLSVALNLWLTRFDGARFVDDAPLGDGLRAVRLALPDGRGLAALWNAEDDRYTPAEAPALGVLPRLRLAVDGLMAETLFGGHVPADGAALGFDPLLLVAPDVDTLSLWLSSARVDSWQPATVGWRLAVRDRAPGLLLDLRNGSASPQPMPLAVRTDAGLALTAGHLNPLLAPGDQSLWLPLRAWPERAAGTVRVLAETNGALSDSSRVLWAWPEMVGWRGLRADGGDDDWDNQPARAAGTEDRLAAIEDHQWDGPDDASLAVRGDWRDGQLWLLVDVTDDIINGGDLLDISLDLDPASAPVDAVGTEADHRLRIRPWIENRLIGACEVTRLEPDAPQAINDKALRLGFRGTSSGWSAELCLPLTPEAAHRLDTGRVLGLQVQLTDDDGDRRPASRVVFLGSPDDTALLPQVWLANQRLDAAAPPDLITAPQPRRLAFDGGDAAASLQPGGFGSAEVRYVDVDDWIRGRRVLRVTRRSESEPSTIALAGPAGRVGLWVRAWPADERLPAPRIGLGAGGATRWFRPDARWRRIETTVAEAASVVVDGVGEVELAEIVRP